MKTYLALAAAILLAAFSGCGGSGGDEAAGDKIFPYPYTIDDLPNGLRLVTVPTGLPNVVGIDREAQRRRGDDSRG